LFFFADELHIQWEVLLETETKTLSASVDTTVHANSAVENVRDQQVLVIIFSSYSQYLSDTIG